MNCPKCRTENAPGSKFCRECATPLPAGPAEEPQASFTRTLETTAGELARGTVFAGRYEIIEELGAGGMGRVYRAYDKKIEEEVAIKLIRPEIAAEKRTVERFRNELKTARKITHPNVCRTHDLGAEGKALFITMEYVRGEDLKSVIRRMRVLAPGTAVSIARQVAEGLGEAHRLGVVHRDLKPGNIMVDKDGNAKIMDFGIARSLMRAGTTAEGAIIGTPEYMSPEQVEGKPADVRADIYALGVILFEMVTGRPPFEGETALAVAHKHKYEPAPDPQALNPQLPAALGRLILRSMEKERERRYQTTAELLADLQAVEAALPSTERIPGRAPSRTRPAASKTITVKITPRKLVIPAAALIAIVVGVVFIWRPWSPREGTPVFPSDRPSIAILPLADRTGQKDFGQYRDVLSMAISDRLSQSKFLEVRQPDQVASVLSRLGLQETDNFTRENLRAIGRRGVVKYLASGHYTKAGERFLVRVMILEAETGRLIGTEEVQGESIDSLFAMVDELILKMKPNLEMTAVEAANDIDGRSSRVMTSSLEAYNYYAQGLKFSHTFKWREGIEMLEKAVAIDPEFAMAYLHLGAWYGNMGNRAEWRKNLDKALELANRLNLPPREKLNIEGYAKTDIMERLAALNRLLELYPDDSLGNGRAAGLFFSLEDFEKAVACGQVIVRKKDVNPILYNNLAIHYCPLGEYAKAAQVLKGYIRDFPDSPNIASVHRPLCLVYTAAAEYELALAELKELARLDPSQTDWIVNRKAVIFHLQGDFDKAETEARKLLDADAARNLNVYENHLAPLYVARGMFARAEDILKDGIDLADKAKLPQRAKLLKFDLIDLYHQTGKTEAEEALLLDLWKQTEAQGQDPGGDLDFLVARAKMLIKKNSFEGARADCSAIASIIEKDENKKMIRWPLYLEGMIESAMGNQAKAIELLTKAKSMMPPGEWTNTDNDAPARIKDPLALAFFRAGDLEKARQEYELITRMTYGRYRLGGVYAKSFYMLGQIYEKMGQKKQARANYRKFLDLWKNAEPDLVEVEDANKRLAGLDTRDRGA